jgi:subfamily B ATP-binding cassette protein MsbA
MNSTASPKPQTAFLATASDDVDPIASFFCIQPIYDYVALMKRYKSISPRQRYLLSLVANKRLQLLTAMACMMIVAGSTAASAFLVKPVLDDIFFRKDVHMLKLIPAAVVLIYFLRGLGYYGQQYFMNHVGQDIIRQLRNRLYDRIQDLPLSFFHQEKTGVLMSRITNDVNIIKSMVSTAVTGSLRDGFTILGLTGVIFYRDWKLALYAMIILPLAFFPVVEFGRRVRRVSTGCQEAMAELSAFLHETFAGNKIVKAFGMEAYEKQRFFEKTKALFRLEMKAVVARSLSSPIMEFLGGIGIAFIIWYGGFRVITGSSTAGTFFSFMAAVLMLYDPVKKLSGLNNAIQEGSAAADRIFDIIERESEIREPVAPATIPDGPHRVNFHDVHFRYEAIDVLKGINLEVNPGEILALVGMSGGGKTSLVNLIPRFYDVSQGAIEIDGLDIRKMSLGFLRRQIAIVTQEPILFNDTVRANITYGNFAATEKDILKAAEAAYALDFIRSFPQGFDTPIGELGARLSGGEKQRLCIARALLKDAPILILDEATSSLDTEAEMLVQKALENLMKGRTTFVIAHRLSTIGHADRIVVIVDGRIIEQGRHEDLMAAGGEYRKLYQMQFSNSQP